MDAAGRQDVLLLQHEVEPTTTTVRRGGWKRGVVGPLVVVLIAAAFVGGLGHSRDLGDRPIGLASERG